MQTQTQIQKNCCAEFYERPEIRLLFGDFWHPGGAALTSELARRLRITSQDRVLDVASALGSTPAILAKEFGCSVVGVDLSARNLVEARSRRTANLSNLISFARTDAENLPFKDESFDVVMSECSLCTFPSKESAAHEMFRLLAEHGRLGIADIMVENDLPPSLRETLHSFLCIADARSEQGYQELFVSAGFDSVQIRDRTEALVDLLDKLKKALFAVELMVGLNKLDISSSKIQTAKTVISDVTHAIVDGIVHYGLMNARKP